MSLDSSTKEEVVPGCKYYALTPRVLSRGGLQGGPGAVQETFSIASPASTCSRWRQSRLSASGSSVSTAADLNHGGSVSTIASGLSGCSVSLCPRATRLSTTS